MTSDTLSDKREKFKPLVNMALTSLSGQARLDFILDLFDEVEKQDREFILKVKEINNRFALRGAEFINEKIDSLAGPELTKALSGDLK
jgi:hypothetical protein